MPNEDPTKAVQAGHFEVKKDGSALSDQLASALHEVVADLDATRPSMFVLRFVDQMAPGTDVDVNFKIGDEVEILEHESSKSLIKGEVTSLEAEFGPHGQSTVVRGYEKLHRLHRTRKYRTFLEQKDSDIVSQVVSAASLTAGKVDATSQVHKFIAQVNQTDWEFLKWRAEENGRVLDMSDGSVNFMKQPSASSAAASLSVTKELIAFRPRMSAPPVSNVTVRAWDQKRRRSSGDGIGRHGERGDLTDCPAPSRGSSAATSTSPPAARPRRLGDATAIADALAERYADSFVDAEAVAYGNTNSCCRATWSRSPRPATSSTASTGSPRPSTSSTPTTDGG